MLLGLINKWMKMFIKWRMKNYQVSGLLTFLRSCMKTISWPRKTTGLTYFCLFFFFLGYLSLREWEEMFKSLLACKQGGYDHLFRMSPNLRQWFWRALWIFMAWDVGHLGGMRYRIHMDHTEKDSVYQGGPHSHPSLYFSTCKNMALLLRGGEKQLGEFL